MRVIAVAAVLNFLPTILTDFLKFSRETASYGSAFFFAGGIAGSLAAGRYSGRFSPMPVLIAGTLLIIPSIAALTLALPFWGYLILISLFGFFGSGCIISQNLLLTSMGSHLGKGEVFGILMGALTLTSAFSPALFGISADKMGFEYSLQIFSTPLLLSSLLLFLLLEKKGFAASKK